MVRCILCGNEVENSEKMAWDIHPLCESEYRALPTERPEQQQSSKQQPPASGPEQQPPAYTPGQSGLFKRRDGTEFDERKR